MNAPTIILFLVLVSVFPAVYIWLPKWFDKLADMLGYAPNSKVFEFWKENFTLRCELEELKVQVISDNANYCKVKRDLDVVLKIKGVRSHLKNVNKIMLAKKSGKAVVLKIKDR